MTMLTVLLAASLAQANHLEGRRPQPTERPTPAAPETPPFAAPAPMPAPPRMPQVAVRAPGADVICRPFADALRPQPAQQGGGHHHHHNNNNAQANNQNREWLNWCNAAYASAIPAADTAFNNGSRLGGRRDRLHRMFAEVVRYAINQNRLNRAVFADTTNHVGLRAFNQLTPAQLVEMIEATAQMQGAPDARAAMLYIEAFHHTNLRRDEVLRALGLVGGPLAFDILMREGLGSNDAALRAAALDGFQRSGGAGLQYITQLLSDRISRGAETLTDQERALVQQSPQLIAQLEQEVNRQLAALDQEHQTKTAQFEQRRQQLQQANDRMKQEIQNSLRALEAPQATPSR